MLEEKLYHDLFGQVGSSWLKENEKLYRYAVLVIPNEKQEASNSMEVRLIAKETFDGHIMAKMIFVGLNGTESINILKPKDRESAPKDEFEVLYEKINDQMKKDFGGTGFTFWDSKQSEKMRQILEVRRWERKN